MITEDDATRLLKQADPARLDRDAPEIDASSFLADLQARTTELTLIEIDEPPPAPGAPRR